MFMLIPLNGDDTQESTITSIEGRKTMAKIEFEGHEVTEVTFIDDIEAELAGGIDYLIVDNPDQEIDLYFEYDVEVLQCMPNATIDDIMEGFLFRTLREVS